MEIKNLESLGIYDGNEKAYYGQPFIKVTTDQKIEGDIGSIYPQLELETTFILKDEIDGKEVTVKEVPNKISLQNAVMFRHAHQKVTDRVIYVYTFVVEGLIMTSKPFANEVIPV